MLCNLKGTTPYCLLLFYNKENKLQVVSPIYNRSLLLVFSLYRKDYKWSITSGKDAQSNHTIKYSLFDGVSCADSVEVFSRILQRLLFSNVVSWVKEWGSHPPFYNHKLLARPLDWPLDPYYMPAQPPRHFRIWLCPNFGAGAGLTLGPLLNVGKGVGLTFGPLFYAGTAASPH